MNVFFLVPALAAFGLWILEKRKAQKLSEQVFQLSLEKRGLEVENQSLKELEKTFKLLSQEALEKIALTLLKQLKKNKRYFFQLYHP